MSTKTGNYPLRLPLSLKAELEKLSKQDGTSINQFVVVAVAEKISTLTAETFFEERRAKANRKEFRRILTRKGGQPPQPGDEL